MRLNTFFQSLKNIFLRTDLSFWSVSAIKPTDVIDILIVAYIVYKLTVWLKNTRAWSPLRGITIILIISVLAYFMNLYTITWIVSNTFGVGLTALVILFQPEMRKALERIGRTRAFGLLLEGPGSGQDASKRVVEGIVSAALEMSKVKTGALIVIENEQPLSDLEQTGISIDAIVSKQLLINIFEKNTPLHDGAVIIRSNRIAAAACILPLTSNDVEHDLGTRHRAAIGMSEASDAFVLVVSEETGSISIAAGGVLRRKLDERKIWGILYKDSAVPKKRLINLGVRGAKPRRPS